MDLSIVIVNWNAKEYLMRSIRSVYEHCGGVSFEIFVVDNASLDGSVDMIKREFPKVILIENSGNPGFGAANNQALRRSSGEFALILNPDTEILPGSLNKMVNFFRQNARAGAVGAKLLNSDGTVQLTCARNFPTLLTEFFWLTTLVRRFPKNKIVGRYLMSYWDHNDTREVDCLSGACIMARGSVLQGVDFFDESYFMYGEDIDLCYRIKKAGWQVWYLSDAGIIHYGGGSSHRIAERAAVYDRISLTAFFRKHRGTLYASAYRIMCLFVGLGMAAISGIVLLFARQRHKVKKLFFENLAISQWSVGLKKGRIW